MASATIGGEQLPVTLDTYKRLKAAWQYIEPAQGADNFVTGMDALIGTIAVGSLLDVPGESAQDHEIRLRARIDEIEGKLKPSEIPALRPFLNDLLIEAGLIAPQGEPKAAENPSTETSTGSSPS